MITRFAPSPTGRLHLGHALSALTVWDIAQAHGGVALLRIEDTDSTRVRPEYEAAIYEDLTWLGLSWPTPVLRQSEHLDRYLTALEPLLSAGLLYPCSCTRRQIMDAGGTMGTDGIVYPRTCAHRPLSDRREGDALRLNLSKVQSRLSGTLRYLETGQNAGQHRTCVQDVIAAMGDPVLIRKDTGDAAYHLACVIDDAHQTISHVVRGADLEPLTPLQVVLQHLFDYPTPVYHHHRLITDTSGKRLAKIDKSRSLAKYRAEGLTPSDIITRISFRPSQAVSG